jgi:predicted O-methyltransferase YrrM
MALSRVTTLPRRGVRAAAEHLTVWQLQRSPHAAVRRVATALNDVARHRFSPESERWFGRIEALRGDLAASTDRVEVVDYGAGLPTSVRTDDEMGHGFVSHPEVSRLTTTASLPSTYGRVLHAIVSSTGVRRGIELGTCLGISAAYQAAALAGRDNARFVTCEGAPALAALARRNLDGLGLGTVDVVAGRFADTLPTVAAEQDPVDYAFIDGHHDEHATVGYFDLLLPHLGSTAVLVFDDIRWSAGMSRAWDAIRSAQAVLAAVDLRRLGLVVVATAGS